jgi:hypothetical protein
MLENLSEEIAECYRRAAEAREWAMRAHDPALKQDFLDMERRWMSLAHSWEFTQRLSDFAAEAKRHGQGASDIAR